MRVACTISVSEAVHHISLTGWRCWCGACHRSDRIAAEVCYSWWCRSYRIGHAVHCGIAIGRHGKVRDIDRVCISPYMRVACTISVSEAVHHISLTGWRCWCGACHRSDRIAAEVCYSWWCRSYRIDHAVHCGIAIGRHGKVRDIDRVCISPYMRVACTISVSEAVHHISLTGWRCWCGACHRSDRIAAEVCYSWWCRSYRIDHAVHCGIAIGRHGKVRDIDRVCISPYMRVACTISVSEAVHHISLTGWRCWCGACHRSDRIAAEVCYSWWCRSYRIDHAVHCGIAIGRHGKVRDIDRVCISPYMRVACTISVSEAVHHISLTGWRCWCGACHRSDRIAAEVCYSWWCRSYRIGHAVHCGIAIGRHGKVRDIDRVCISPYMRVACTISVSEAVHHISLTGWRCW